MPYTEIGLCIVGTAVFFGAGRMESETGAADHSILWGALSLLVSIAAFGLGGGWIAWLIAQIVLFFGIAAVRAALEGRRR
jgi:O-antigen ligase